MRTYVVTGGTDGIGRAVAHAYLDRGHQVVVIGRNAEKGAAWLAAARRRGATARAHFIRTDLSLLSETRTLIDAVRSSFAKVDALVLCARHFRTTRLETAEGFENTLAHFYLSRFLLGHGLAGALESADAPVVLNVAGPGGGGEIHWDDLQLTGEYDGHRALMQGGRLNDLLGVAYAELRPNTSVRYVLFNPGPVRTAFSGEYTPDALARLDAVRRTAASVEDAVTPILDVLDAPPAAGLSAFTRGRPLDTSGPEFAVEDARRLHLLTERLLAGLG
ncbi:SDR family NAD(P)-dependent oxidoreductase [Streptomyces sp. NPDC047315]|uniref:SDR family NAD(P)-dependent oxidoreductase n=1 Tax=Streptomyces sp. NPDC047315 TaxID=3155142 RepID=UPI0033F7023D